MWGSVWPVLEGSGNLLATFRYPARACVVPELNWVGGYWCCQRVPPVIIFDPIRRGLTTLPGIAGDRPVFVSFGRSLPLMFA